MYVNLIRPSSCWRCRVLFEDDDSFRHHIFSLLNNAGAERAREAVDERFAEKHASHTESWI